MPSFLRKTILKLLVRLSTTLYMHITSYIFPLISRQLVYSHTCFFKLEEITTSITTNTRNNLTNLTSIVKSRGHSLPIINKRIDGDGVGISGAVCSTQGIELGL